MYSTISKVVVIFGSITFDQWQKMKGNKCEGDVLPFMIKPIYESMASPSPQQSEAKDKVMSQDTQYAHKLMYHLLDNENEFPTALHLANVILHTYIFNSSNFDQCKGYEKQYKNIFERADYILFFHTAERGKIEKIDLKEKGLEDELITKPTDSNLASNLGCESIENDFFKRWNLLLSSIDTMKNLPTVYIVLNENEKCVPHYMSFLHAPFELKIVSMQNDFLEFLALEVERSQFSSLNQGFWIE